MVSALSLLILLAAATALALYTPAPRTLSTAEFAALISQQMPEHPQRDTHAKARRSDGIPLGADTYYDMVFAVSQLRYQQASPDARPLWPDAAANSRAQGMAQVALLLDAGRLVSLPVALNSTTLYATGQDIDGAMQAWLSGCDECQRALVSSSAAALGLGRAGDYWVLYISQT
ncbi:hypothetical protein LPJ53_005700 [Coemansia erecta]|uniref:SCP domain-containing protein n=1 Tax=Coemansia erecta TaxID=147472 RepID=A0A9W8CNI4_9FUNG|nr:hypothetical protein LPJ53_005700 [Coemansia erecta]